MVVWDFVHQQYQPLFATSQHPKTRGVDPIQLHPPRLNSTHAPGFVILSETETCREKTRSQKKKGCKLRETDSIPTVLISITNLRMYKLRIKSPIILNLFLWFYPQLEEIIHVDTYIFVKRVAFFNPKMLSFFRVAPKRTPPARGGTEEDEDFWCCAYMYVYIYIYICRGFLKWWYPTTMGFPTRNHHFGVFGGYHYLRKHPYMYRKDITNSHSKEPFFHQKHLYISILKLRRKLWEGNMTK